ncbi:MAG: hypothetical protein KAV82_02155 [Phycisphaerae bacterium]|nr:hypothetical protein [Phycisphaerae bacterium]
MRWKSKVCVLSAVLLCTSMVLAGTAVNPPTAQKSLSAVDTDLIAKISMVNKEAAKAEVPATPARVSGKIKSQSKMSAADPGAMMTLERLPLPTANSRDSGDCCEGATGDPPGCEDPVCEAAVCAVDNYCCNTSWDGQCVILAEANESCDCEPVINNDTCETATVVNCGDVLAGETNAGLNNDYDPESGGCTGYAEAGPDAVYSLAVADTQEVTVAMTNLDYDAALYVVTDCGDVVGTCVAGSDNCCGGADEGLMFDAEAGITYFIIADCYGESNEGGPFDLSVSCGEPPTGACCVDGVCEATNTAAECAALAGIWFEGETCPEFQCPNIADECAQAATINCGQSITFDLTGITSGGTENDPTSSCEIASGGPYTHDASVWFQFTATSATGTLSMCDSDLAEDSVMTVFTYDSTCDALVEHQCDDDFCSAPDFGPPEITLAGLVPGETYLVLVDFYSGGHTNGPHTIALTCDAPPQPGACCNNITAECNDGVELVDCVGTDMRFEEGVLCADLDPPCGVVLGACCHPDGTCDITEESACADMWLGADTTCDECPCIVTCPAGATPEGEPICGPDYQDVTNAGCNDETNPVFSPANCDETICGESGSYEGDITCEYDSDCPYYTSGETCDLGVCSFGPYTFRDTDWYEITLTETKQLAWTVEADFPVLIFLMDAGAGDCSDHSTIASATAAECEEVVVSACLPPGNYYLWVGADFDGAFLPECGAIYVGMVTCEDCAVGACCMSDGTCSEVPVAECEGTYMGDGTLCVDTVCTGACCNPDGSCDDLSEDACTENFMGIGTECATTTCPVTPDNDECVDAVEIAELPASITFDNTNATDDVEEPCGEMGTYPPAKTVWFTVTGTGNSITATTCNAGTEVSDTKIAVYCGDCDYLICVAGNDDECDGYANYLSTLTWCSEMDTTYYVLVGLYRPTTEPGIIQLDLSDDGVACTPDVDCTIPTGACCTDTGCQVLTPGECAAAGGSYVGDDVSCDPDPCAVGACCLWPSGDCEEYTEAECTDAGGTFMGYGSTCATTMCPTPGDNCEAPMPVTLGVADLPYVNANTTCGREDNYSDTCLGSYDGDEDMIYELTITEDMWVNIVLEPLNDTTWTGVGIGDTCPLGEDCIATATGSGSEPRAIEELFLTAGVYYIHVDIWPWPFYCYEFILTIEQFEPCNVVCDPSATPENEPLCGYNYDDETNGGCLNDPPVFSPLSLDEIICGESGTYEHDIVCEIDDDCPAGETCVDDICTGDPGQFRDTDWYEFTIADWTEITWTVEAEFDVLIGLMDNGGDPETCTTSLLLSDTAGDCEEISITQCLSPGTWWVIVAPNVFEGVPCGMEYEATLTGVPCEPQYCDATTLSCYEYISRVAVGAIDNSSECDNYADYTDISTEMEIGSEYAITVENGHPYSSDQCALWVDWNKNYVFEESEMIFLGEGLGPYTGIIIPPVDAVIGDTVMRVRIDDGYLPVPCGDTQYGEVEDYTITVVGGFWCDLAEPFGVVDEADYYVILDAFGSRATDPEPNKFVPEADFDEDGYISLVDFQAWMQCYSEANGKAFKVPHSQHNLQPRPVVRPVQPAPISPNLGPALEKQSTLQQNVLGTNSR